MSDSGLLAGLAIVFVATVALAEEAPALRNGALSEWRDGLPAGWRSSEGARTGPGDRTSRVEPLPGGGLALSGDATTDAWRLVSQPVGLTAERTYRLSFEARAVDIRREQRGDAYVGLILRAKEGRPVFRVKQLLESEWARHDVFARVPAGATAEVAVFLSRSGRLEVRSAALEALAPEEVLARSFDVLVTDMDRHYSYFALRGTDWNALTGRYRERAHRAKDEAELLAVLREMLGELRDEHVWIVPPGGAVAPTFAPEVARNFDHRFVAKERLKTVRQIGKLGLVGWTREGFAYLAVGSLAGPEEAFAELYRAVDGLLDAPGFLIDLRGNTGGDERRAQRIASCFTDEPRVYAKARYRSGPGHADFGPFVERRLAPRDGKRSTRPIVCLTGRACMSSGEGFVKMIRALPQAVLVGQPTRGASGNPAPVELPCGASVFYSRWADALPDGTETEGKGVAPDVLVEHEGAGDATFDAAVKVLAARVAGRGE